MSLNQTGHGRLLSETLLSENLAGQDCVLLRMLLPAFEFAGDAPGPSSYRKNFSWYQVGRGEMTRKQLQLLTTSSLKGSRKGSPWPTQEIRTIHYILATIQLGWLWNIEMLMSWIFSIQMNCAWHATIISWVICTTYRSCARVFWNTTHRCWGLQNASLAKEFLWNGCPKRCHLQRLGSKLHPRPNRPSEVLWETAPCRIKPCATNHNTMP